MAQAKLKDINEPVGKIIVALSKDGEIFTGTCIIARNRNLIFRNIYTNKKYSLGRNTKLSKILSE